MSETGIDWPALLALEGQATAGPWGVGVLWGSCELHTWPHPGPPACQYTWRVDAESEWERRQVVAGMTTLIGTDDDGPILSAPDAAFIAASRQAVPALVALVRGLAGALDDAAHRFGEIFEAARGEFIMSAATNGEQAALMALATIPAALRAGVGE